MSNYVYKTVVRNGVAATCKFAEVQYGKIVAFHEHWVPLEQFRNFFEAGAQFLDVTGVLIDGEEPTIGDTVNKGETGYEIVHFKSTSSVAETKNYKIEMFKLQRNVKELEPIEWNGIMFDADKDSLTRLDKARIQMEDEGLATKLWTTADNSHAELTLADFAGINSAIANRATLLHARYNQLKEYINAIDGDKYLPVILVIDWDWDIECNLDEKLAELTTEE
jgi:hypothetical protein